MKECDEKGDRHWFQKNQGKIFTIPYSRSDAFRDAINGRNTNTFNNNCVYPKRTRPDTSHIPETIELTKEFGFFVGAYLAEGMSNSTQINITNNDSIYIDKVKSLMDEWNVGTHIVSEDRNCEKTGIKGHTTSLVIHSTLLAKIMGEMFGKVSYEKTLPDWVLQSSDDFVKGLVDGYISGDGYVCAKTGCVRASSVSKKLIEKFIALFARYNIFTTMSSYMPEIKKFNSVSQNYSFNILAKYSKVFAETFTLSITNKQDRLEHHFIHNDTKRRCVRKSLNNIVWDKVKTIREVSPLKEWVYDITVENTRNFTTLAMTSLKDTFHLAGVASKSNVTRGVPRLKELLKVTQNPKAISLTVPLKKEFRESIDKARQVAQDLELTLLKDIVTKCKIYFDPFDETSVVEEDRKLLQFYKMFENKEETNEEISKWLLRLEFDKEAMFKKNISLDNVAFVLSTKFDENVNLVYSDYNSENLVMRIRLTESDKDSSKDDILNLKKFENKILTSIVIRGIPSIKSVSYRKDTNYYELVNNKYEQITQYILDTDGSNFLEIINHPYVNGNAVLSSHVHDIYENLGIEAARATLLNEITNLFAEAGGVDFRHLGLLCDWITRVGKLLSVDRYGINKQDIGPLSKASFEETERILLKAAIFGEVDPIVGVSANIMTGQPIRGGTSFSEILFDEQAFMRLQEGLPPVPDSEEEEEYEATEEDIENELYESAEDKCAVANLKLNVTLGAQTTVDLEEPDVEVIMIDEKD
jgi:DNA-directed RNA polymerase beta' subunit